ncbi:hypothetical protein [Streptomyces sp. NPDC092903]|uniref:hypothetical protein n=1 Tax=Streptomyces sp. NPDC092903 TaxID=3366017 RepID=UPI0038287FA0
MRIEQYVVDVRRQHTGESLREARLRLADLRDWSELVPTAKDSEQARLESNLLEALGCGQGVNPLGVSEVIPCTDQLELRLESAEQFSSLLPLLPYKDRRRTQHGVLDLRAYASRQGVELTLGRTAAGRVRVLGPAGCDLAAILDAHRTATEEQRYEPLWTKDTSHGPMPRPLRRSTGTPSKTTKPVDPHSVRPYLASGLLRRLHLWPSLIASSTVTFTSQPHATGLTWTVQHGVPHHRPVHNASAAAALTDTVAGPGLTLDADSHHCDHQQCVQTFASGQLTVRTTHASNPHSVQRPGRARANVLSTFLSEAQPPASGPEQTSGGHVLQLVDPWGDDRLDAAKQLTAAWAQQELRTLVLRVDSSSNRPGETGSWKRARLTGGKGAMFTKYAEFGHGDLEAAIARAREEFDHVIMIKRQWTGLPLAGLSPLADDHIVVAGGDFDRTTKTTRIRAGELRRTTIPLTPAESAVAWLNRHLARVPFAEVPLTGLVLWCAPDERGPNAFDTEVDVELARHGVPVLGRLPRTPRRSPHRTVLDRLPDERRVFETQQAMQIRSCFNPPRENAEVFLATLREYAEC